MQIVTVLSIALLVSILWGSQPVIHKHLITNLNPVTVLFFQTVVNFSCILLFATLNYREIYSDYVTKVNAYDWYWIVFLAVFTVFGTNVMYLYILKSNESSLVSALVYSAPVFTMILAYFSLSEKIDMNGIIGILLITVGVCFIAMNVSNTEDFLLGSKFD